jgi:uncharacterized integral membrane protein
MHEQRAQSAPMPSGPEEPDLGDRLKLAGAVVAAVALVLFFFQNLQQVKINFLWMDWNTQMIWALLVSALLGAVAVFLASTVRRWRAQRPPAQPQQR